MSELVEKFIVRTPAATLPDSRTQLGYVISAPDKESFLVEWYCFDSVKDGLNYYQPFKTIESAGNLRGFTSFTKFSQAEKAWMGTRI